MLSDAIALKELTTHLFSKYLLSVYHVSSTIPGAVDITMNKRDMPQGAYILVP